MILHIVEGIIYLAIGAAVYMVGYIHGYIDGVQRWVARKRAQ